MAAVAELVTKGVEPVQQEAGLPLPVGEELVVLVVVAVVDGPIRAKTAVMDRLLVPQVRQTDDACTLIIQVGQENFEEKEVSLKIEPEMFALLTSYIIHCYNYCKTII